jgi:hypothetical protein
MIVSILDWETVVAFSNACALGKVGQIVLVIVVLDETLLGSFAVMNGSLDFRSDHRHPGDDTLHLNKLIDKICFKASWGHVIFTEVALKVYIVSQDLLGEMDIRACGSCFLGVLLAIILLHSSNCGIERILKHFDGFDGIFGNVVTQFWGELPHLINADAESLALADHCSHPFLVFCEVEKLCGGITHVSLVGIL